MLPFSQQSLSRKDWVQGCAATCRLTCLSSETPLLWKYSTASSGRVQLRTCCSVARSKDASSTAASSTRNLSPKEVSSAAAAST